jgi:hypothetical protein
MRFSVSPLHTVQLGIAISVALFWCGLAKAETTCFGIADTDTANVCSGQGTCDAPDTCSCFDYGIYTGPECEQPVCNGFPSTNSSVCSGRGSCDAPDTCSCEVGYGPDCEYLDECNGWPITDPNVCSGQGTCVAQDTCVCDDPTAFSGVWCEQPVCFGLLSSDPGVCSGQGTCTAPDTCSCFDLNVYTGPQCEQPVCNGFPSTNPSVCSGRGTCDAPDTCSCEVGHTGSNCELGPIVVPALSSRGLSVFALLMLATGLVMANRRGARATP